MKFQRYGNGIAKGMVVTLTNFLRKPITTQYPEERDVVSKRSRGNGLIWDQEKCTGCGLCVKACPQGDIELVTHKEEKKFVVDKFEHDKGHCLFCGLCVEGCPAKALLMEYGYEAAVYSRASLICNKEQLLMSEGKIASGYSRPDVAAELPEQTLLLNRKHKRGQKNVA